jgi:hypothetical protein
MLSLDPRGTKVGGVAMLVHEQQRHSLLAGSLAWSSPFVFAAWLRAVPRLNHC